MSIAPPRVFPEVRGVPQSVYTDEDVFALELDPVLRLAWRLAWHVSEVKTAGSFLTRGKDEIVVVSDETAKLQAHFNVCSNRGHPLLQDRSGQLASSRL